MTMAPARLPGMVVYYPELGEFIYFELNTFSMYQFDPGGMAEREFDAWAGIMNSTLPEYHIRGEGVGSPLATKDQAEAIGWLTGKPARRPESPPAEPPPDAWEQVEV